MVREIYKDQFFLSQKCVPATPGDLPVATDLLDTLQAHQAGCVGMAANMIGVQKRIIAFDCEGTYRLMLNPVIIKKSGSYEAEEGAFLCREPAKPDAGNRSKSSIKTSNFRLACKRSPAGRRRSFNMKSIIVRVF